jgi:hypothetical protein
MSNDLFTLNKKLNRVMNMVYSWFWNNNLVLNLSKSHLIKFLTPKSPEYTLSVIYNNFRLKVVDNVTFLGVELDCQLNWKQYAEKLLNKLNIACFMIRKLQALVSEQILRMIYVSCCPSQLEYGIIFWGSSLVMKTLFLAQKRVIRFLLRLGPRDSCREVFERLGILTVPSLYIYSMLMFVVKNRKFYLTNNNIHHINTRQSGMLMCHQWDYHQ